MEWVEASAHGTLYSFVETRFAFHKGIKGCLPLGLCAVTLDEGPRVFGRLLGYEDIEKVPTTRPSTSSGSGTRKKAPPSWAGNSTESRPAT